jgi:hypothetical protein
LHYGAAVGLPAVTAKQKSRPTIPEIAAKQRKTMRPINGSCPGYVVRQQA